MGKCECGCDCNIIHQEIVNKIQKDMIKDELLKKVANYYKMLGDNTRIKILYILSKEKMCVCDIANILKMSKSSISHQLGTLREQGIVKCQKNGKEVHYMLDDNHVKDIINITIKHLKHKGCEKNEI